MYKFDKVFKNSVFFLDPQVTVGIIACIEVTSTTTATTPETTSMSLPITVPTSASTTSIIPLPPTSGTTVIPTSVSTTPICQQAMAQFGRVYVSSVDYSQTPTEGTNDDLTSTTGNGVSFSPVEGTSGLTDANNNPLYTITLTFNTPGVYSLSSITVNPESNVKEFSVEFFTPSNGNQPVTVSTQSGNIPLSYNSKISNSQVLIDNFPEEEVPTPLSGIRISVLATLGNQ